MAFPLSRPASGNGGLLPGFLARMMGRGNGGSGGTATLPPPPSKGGMVTGGDGRPIPKPPALLDPKDPSSDIRPDDLVTTPQNPPESDQELVDWILSCYGRAKRQTKARRNLWRQCRRYDAGDQWFIIDDMRGVVDARTPEQIARCFTVNLVSPLVQKVVAMATQSKPDAAPQPQTGSDLDVEAANEARISLGHLGRKNKDQLLMSEQVYHALVTTRSYRYPRWDKDALAMVPVYDRVGQLLGAKARPVGDEIEEVIPGEFVFWDPGATREEDATWVLIVRVKPVTWVQKTFATSTNHQAWAIKGDAYVDGIEGGDAARINTEAGAYGNAGSAGEGGWGTRPADHDGRDGVVLFEYLEKPNPRRPEGRMLYMADKRIMRRGKWAYEKADSFPLCGLHFKPNHLSPYSFGLVEQLIDCQATINTEWSRIIARLDKDKRVILVEALSGIGADAYQEQADLARVNYMSGSNPPQIVQPPQINPQHFELMERAYRYMQDISGIVDVLQGKAPPGVTAGITIDMLTQSAQQQIQPFITSIEQFAVDLAEWRISLYAQFVMEERMIGLDESGTPAGMGPAGPGSASTLGVGNQFGTAPNPAAMPGQGQVPGSPGMPQGMPPQPPAPPKPNLVPFALRALTNGGQTTVQVTPGSATPRSPVGQKQELLEYYNLGLLGGPPGSPDAVKNYWRLAKSTYSSGMLQEMERIQADMEEQARLQVQLEQMQAQSGAAAGDAGAAAAANASVQTQQLKSATELQRQKMESETELTKQQLASAHEMGMARMKHNAKLREIIAQKVAEHAGPQKPAPAPVGKGNNSPAGGAKPAPAPQQGQTRGMGTNALPTLALLLALSRQGVAQDTVARPARPVYLQ